MAWQYLTFPYHGYHGSGKPICCESPSLKDHASNAAKSVDTNLRGLSFFGGEDFRLKTLALEASTSSYNGFGRFLVFGNGRKASHVRRRRLKSETKVCLVFPRYTVQTQYNNGSEG